MTFVFSIKRCLLLVPFADNHQTQHLRHDQNVDDWAYSCLPPVPFDPILPRFCPIGGSVVGKMTVPQFHIPKLLYLLACRETIESLLRPSVM